MLRRGPDNGGQVAPQPTPRVDGDAQRHLAHARLRRVATTQPRPSRQGADVAGLIKLRKDCSSWRNGRSRLSGRAGQVTALHARTPRRDCGSGNDNATNRSCRRLTCRCPWWFPCRGAVSLTVQAAARPAPDTPAVEFGWTFLSRLPSRMPSGGSSPGERLRRRQVAKHRALAARLPPADWAAPNTRSSRDTSFVR